MKNESPLKSLFSRFSRRQPNELQGTVRPSRGFCETGKNINWKKMLFLFSVALNIGFVAFGSWQFFHGAWRHSHDASHFHKAKWNDHLFKRLDLSGDQRTKIDTLLADYAAKRSQLRKDKRLARTELTRLLAQYTSDDQPAVTALVEQMAALKKTQIQLSTDHLLRVRAVLTPDQSRRFFAGLEQALARRTK